MCRCMSVCMWACACAHVRIGLFGPAAAVLLLGKLRGWRGAVSSETKIGFLSTPTPTIHAVGAVCEGGLLCVYEGFGGMCLCS